MEDLRANEEIAKEILDADKTKLYYPSLKVKLVVWFDTHKKKVWKYSIIVLISLLVLKYPGKIGTFIGDWTHEFYSSITKKFKD